MGSNVSLLAGPGADLGGPSRPSAPDGAEAVCGSPAPGSLKAGSPVLCPVRCCLLQMLPPGDASLSLHKPSGVHVPEGGLGSQSSRAGQGWA